MNAPVEIRYRYYLTVDHDEKTETVVHSSHVPNVDDRVYLGGGRRLVTSKTHVYDELDLTTNVLAYIEILLSVPR